MAAIKNPALEEFVGFLHEELSVGQALVRRMHPGYELRHAEDRTAGDTELRTITLQDVRQLSQFTNTNSFRPLKSAPTLRTGWRLHVVNDGDLEVALNHLYPNAIADWYAVRTGKPPVTNYREFTNRQTGMYRITTMLTDAQATQVIQACCGRKFCLKRRLWTVRGLAPDSLAEKTLIPCLEPCAILLEFARKAMRIEQQKKMNIELAGDEVQTIQAALERLSQETASQREADFGSPSNARRIQLLQQKLSALASDTSSPETDKSSHETS